MIWILMFISLPFVMNKYFYKNNPKYNIVNIYNQNTLWQTIQALNVSDV